MLSGSEVTSAAPASSAATSAFVTALTTFTQSLSTSQEWEVPTKQKIAYCSAHSAAGLSLRQLAVQHFMCLGQLLYIDCDRQQESLGWLDADGASRRASFLSGRCPFSPRSIQEVLERLTGRGLDECGEDMYQGSDAHRMYDAEVARVVCLLKRFTKGDGILNYGQLRGVVRSQCKEKLPKKLKGMPGKASGREADGGENENTTRDSGCILKEIVDKCADVVTTEQFVRCWIDVGSPSCAYHQANLVAGQFRHGCRLMLPPQPGAPAAGAPVEKMIQW